MYPYVILGIYVCFGVSEAIRGGFFRQLGAVDGDGKVELISALVFLILTQPAVLFLSAGLMALALPHHEGALAHAPLIAQLGLFLVFDDMMQYWWHRASHSFPWLYKLHRPHHNGEYLSVRVVYRNNIFYYLMMPSLWLSGVLIYLGLGGFYAFYVIVKMSVIIGAHSSVRWDAPLYRIKWLSPVMWVVERLISTPATHAAHHGKHKSDGVTNYKGNFGNLMFLWDVLFGTAKITRRYPEKFGVENLPETSVGEQLLWPLLRSKA